MPAGSHNAVLRSQLHHPGHQSGLIIGNWPFPSLGRSNLSQHLASSDNVICLTSLGTKSRPGHPLSLASPEPDLPKEQDSREKDPHEESFTAQEADDEDKAQKLSALLVELGFLTHRELQQHMVLPLKKDSGELALATGHILSKAVLAEIQKATDIEVKPALVDSGELQASIEGCYRRQER